MDAVAVQPPLEGCAVFTPDCFGVGTFRQPHEDAAGNDTLGYLGTGELKLEGIIVRIGG